MEPINQEIKATVPADSKKASGLINPSQMGVGHSFTEVKSISISERPKGFWKSIAVDFFTVLLALVFSYSFSRYLSGRLSFWFVLGGLLLWGAASVLEGFLQKNAVRRFWIIVLECAVLIAPFYSYAWQGLVITGVLVLLVLLWGYFSVRRELRNTLEMRFFTASGKVVGKVITAAVIFMVVIYASLANNKGNLFVSQEGFNTFFSWGSNFVNNFYPNVPLSGSFGDFAQAVARMQLQGNPTFQSLTPTEQNVALSQSADQVMSTFSTNASGTIATSTASTTAAEATSNAFYDYLSGVFTRLQGRFSTGFVGAWGLILFLILRSAGIIVVWIGQCVALIFYELLLATRFMHIKEEEASKETIEY